MSPLFLLLAILSLFSSYQANGAYFKALGVNFGELGNDLPSAAVSVNRLRHLRAGAVKIYGTNPDILRALGHTRLPVSIMVPDDVIPSLAHNQSAADTWIRTNVLPFYPKTRIRFLLVGNEILSHADLNATWPDIVPAMTLLHSALRAHSVRKIKVGTTLAMDALSVSYPPSAGEFRPDIAKTVMEPMLEFLNKTRSYYFVDAYPFFPWLAEPTHIDLDYCLFNANSSKYYTDTATNLTYTNLLDQMLDATIFAMKRVGYGSVKLAVAETGWPNAGDEDEIGANIYNAATYNRNLAKRMRIRPPVGTPSRPGWYIPLFLFSLYNENQKPGPGTERHWGILYPNGTEVYEVDLTGKRTKYKPLPLPTNNKPIPDEGNVWCVLKEKANMTAVGDALSYACGQGKKTCDDIQKGGKCYEPNTLASHASYAFNSYWQQFKKLGGSCNFNGLAVKTKKDPSYGSCKFVAI